MCHIILGLPLIGLILFYYLPFKTAIAIYVPLLFLSLFIYYKIKKAMESVPKGGMDETMGEEGDVIEPLTPDGRIRVKDEIWYARSTEPVMEGERGRIVGFDGLTLIIEPVGKDPPGKKAKIVNNKDLSFLSVLLNCPSCRFFLDQSTSRFASAQGRFDLKSGLSNSEAFFEHFPILLKTLMPGACVTATCIEHNVGGENRHDLILSENSTEFRRK